MSGNPAHRPPYPSLGGGEGLFPSGSGKKRWKSGNRANQTACCVVYPLWAAGKLSAGLGNQVFTSSNRTIMAKSVKGTQTEKNLLTSFAGESQARMRYTYFASVAKKEGYEQIAAIFAETADQEKEHAERMFKFLEGGKLEITARYPAGVIGTTVQNLKAAASGEHEEWATDYPYFAGVAEQEGFHAIALMYRNIIEAEKAHEAQYLALMKNVEQGTVFRKEEETTWQCRNCGYVHTGKEAPEKCPACLHAQAYFEVKKTNY